MTRARPLPFWSVSALSALASVPAFAVMLGCSSTGASDALTPITGITVRAETLSSSRGCGRGTTQIFKYAVVVFGRDPGNLSAFTVPVTGGVYDCFTDAQFVNVPQSGGSFDYSLQVYAYNEAAFQAAGEDKVKAAVADPKALPGTNPTFSTTCSAQELDQVQSLAACQPLSLGAGGATGTQSQPASVVLPVALFPTADGRSLACGASYTAVRYRADINGVQGATVDAPCATGVTLSPAVAPASYAIQVALLRSDGSVLGETSCSAVTNPGVTSSASCKPVP